MTMVEWEERYSIGIEDIDRHHQHLVGLLNRSYDAIILEQNLNEVRNILHELLDYAGYHFRAEEEMMKKHGYSKIATHIAEHDLFITKVNELVDRLLSSEVEYDIELINLLEEWLLNHISVVDKAFALYVLARVQ